jgi:hypothetical protein
MKYYLSLCCIIKDERYLEEFIIYYRILGVEHFYIYDNESSPSISDRLNKPFFNDICSIIHFPGKHKQMPSYKHFISNYGHETEWAIICDGDEYILPKHDWSLRDFLDKYNDVQAIGINWVLYGSSYHNNIQDGFLVDKYRHCEGKQDKHIKTVFKPRFIKDWDNPHFGDVKNPNLYIDAKRNIINGPFNYNISNDIIQINHYFTRSLEDSYIKKNRGRADQSSFGQLLDNNNNELHSSHNDIIDNNCADKYLQHLICIIYAVNTNWEIYRALNPDLQTRLITPDDYDKHLFEHGLRENRELKISDRFPSFNRNIYRSNYPDLSYMNDTELEIHYINDGNNEGRICDRII